jgi:hypothetical protein
VAARSPIPRQSDIIEATERLKGVLADVSLDAFENDCSGHGSSSAVLRSFPKLAVIFQMI